MFFCGFHRCVHQANHSKPEHVKRLISLRVNHCSLHMDNIHKIKFVSYNTNSWNMNKIAFFRNLRRGQSYKIPTKWIYWSIKVVWIHSEPSKLPKISWVGILYVHVYFCFKRIQSTLVISNSKGLSDIRLVLRDIRTSTHQISRIEGKNNSHDHI